MVAARRQHVALLPHLTSLSAAWQPLGPTRIASLAYGNVTGRVTSIAIDPADTTGNTVYLGTTGGGVWKSTNAAGPASGVTFTALTDTLPVFSANASSSVIPSLSIGAVSANAGVILAGTGDPNDASDSFYGDGILRSANGGLTWTLIQQSFDGAAGNHLFLGLGFSGFAWSTSSPGTVVAAVSQSAEGSLVNAPSATSSVMGVYYSTDAGQTWQMATLMDGGQLLQQPLPSGANSGGHAATAVVWNAVRRRFYAAIRYHGYYESPDGVTWMRLANQPGSGLTLANCPTAPGTIGSVSCPIFRGVLAVQPATGDTFALTVDSNNLDQGLWQDACNLSGGNCASSAVVFANRLDSSPLETGNGSATIAQAGYNLTLTAVPAAQDTLLYAGTVDLYRCSLNAGCVLRNTTNAANGCATPAQVAPAQHAIATLATASQQLLYLGNDGGLWRSIDGVNQQGSPCSAADAGHFQNLNSGLGSLAEVVSFAQHPTDPDTLLVGLGANGTASTAAASSLSAWPQLSAGEGGTVAIDPADPQLWYISTGAGVSIRQCPAGSACMAADFSGAPTIGAEQTSLDASLLDAPWLLDPASPANLILGTCRVWRGPAGNGALWSSANALSSLFGGPQNATCSANNPVLRSLAAGGPASLSATAQNTGSQTLYAGMAGSLDGGLTLGGHLFATTVANTDSSASVWTDLAASPVSNDTHAFNPGGFDLSSIYVDPHDPTGATVYVTVMGFAGNGIAAAHLYRSTDTGAHWTNISSNLPNAPANSVAVDPNDANTLYVAMDTGVYVTQSVSSCATVNCWSVYGSGLPNAPVVQLSVAAGLPAGNGLNGELRAATYGRGIWQIPLLNAAPSVQAAATLSPANLAFTAQAVSTASASQTITVTNSGTIPLAISRLAITGDFSETDTCASATLSPGLTCTVQIQFLPTAIGTRTGLLTLYGNVPTGQVTASLTGAATPPGAIVLTPVLASFPATVINAPSAAQNITISNISSDTVTLQPSSITGDFKITANTCGGTLNASTGCTVAVVFIPTASGTRTGLLTITGSSGTQTASLTGTGTSPATDALSPLSFSFASQQITTASAPQTVTLSNTGDLPLTLIAAQITGDFTVTNSCGNSLNPHSTCALAVAFQPKDVGTRTGVLTVSDQYRSQTVALTGFGIAPPGVTLAPLSTVAFPATGVGIASMPQTVTLTNNGGEPLLIQNIAFTGDFSVTSKTCGSTLATGAACTIGVIFTPTAGGSRSGQLTLTDNAPNSPQTLALTGTGIDFTLVPDGSLTVTTTSGNNAVFPLLISSATNVTESVSFSCTGTPANSTCTITPSTAALSGTTTISVTVLTGVSATSSIVPDHRGQARFLWLAAMIPLGLAGLRRRALPHIAAAAFLSLLVVASGCAVPRTIPFVSNSSSPGTPTGTGAVTPPGTYPITVSATSAGLTRSINLTLIVQ